MEKLVTRLVALGMISLAAVGPCNLVRGCRSIYEGAEEYRRARHAPDRQRMKDVKRDLENRAYDYATDIALVIFRVVLFLVALAILIASFEPWRRDLV